MTKEFIATRVHVSYSRATNGFLAHYCEVQHDSLPIIRWFYRSIAAGFQDPAHTGAKLDGMFKLAVGDPPKRYDMVRPSATRPGRKT